MNDLLCFSSIAENGYYLPNLTSIGHNKNLATFGYNTTISIQRFDFTALMAALPVSPDVPTL